MLAAVGDTEAGKCFPAVKVLTVLLRNLFHMLLASELLLLTVHQVTMQDCFLCSVFSLVACRHNLLNLMF